ncbi:hypothetical protein [Nocardia paucivorans]|uniref:hypothetical protein n=1 Tax=Nocardia paucivorans TaxID=114259 RepID=UPI0002F40D35|nr:hypothetical protein [Nocardia paucivorans]
MLRYTTPAPPVDLAAEVPELAAYTRTTVRLHPKKRRPGVSDSHIGGPLWWPANEPWPTCTEPYLAWVPVVRPDGRHGMRMGPTEAEEPNPLVPIAQLWRRDFPEIDYPDDTDVLQVLWCPDEHDQFDFGGPMVRLVWRHTEPGVALLDSPPTPRRISDRIYLPHPCSLHPERVVEYPCDEVYPPELQERLRQWEIAHFPTTPHDEGYDEEQVEEYGCSCYQYLLSVAPGCKVGGWTSWHATDMYDVPCLDCGGETRELLKLDSCEWDGGSGPRWKPVVDSGTASRDAEPECEPTGLVHGRYAAMTIFTCRTDPQHAPRFTIQ